MRPLFFSVVLLLVALRGLSAPAQGPFRNLDFEEGYLPPVTTDYEPVAIALPGCTVLRGTNVETQISRNGYGVGGLSSVSIFESAIMFPPHQFAGDYYLNFARDDRDPVSTSIYQVGLVPTEVMSLRFVTGVYWWHFPEAMEVRLNGTLVPLQVLSATPASAVMGADISAFAGQTIELRFISLGSTPPGISGVTSLDNIEFSPLPVPEQSTVALGLLGTAALTLALRHRRTRN